MPNSFSIYSIRMGLAVSFNRTKNLRRITWEMPHGFRIVCNVLNAAPICAAIRWRA